MVGNALIMEGENERITDLRDDPLLGFEPTEETEDSTDA
jgi:hypothetical protein